MFAVQVLDAPEAASRDGAFLGVSGEVLSRHIGVERHAGRGCKWTEEASHEVGHCRGHDESED